jgi:putative membrane-bound dehydrogenase-like protein
MTRSRHYLVAAALIIATLARAATGQVQSRASRDADERNDAVELRRFPLKDPADSQREFVVRPGFRVELVAAEPLLRSPVAIDFDEDGRLYIAEFPEYNQYANPKYAGKGCVRLLEDSDGDGTFEKSTLFADEVPMAAAVACWDGGVLVGSAPEMLYCKDTNGDGKADVRRVVFTGFGTDPAGEGMLNSFRWGLDNRFHVSTSLDGGLVRPAKQRDAKTVSVRGNVFLFDPRTETFALSGGGGQHGMSMDDWGRTYVCGNSDPFHLVMYDSRDLTRNPHLQAPPAAINIAPAGKYTKLHRISPIEPWRALRTRLRSQGLVPGSDEGGSPSGFFTGGTGVTVYRGDAFPPEFRGNLFVGDVSNNVIHRALAVPSGLLVVAKTAEADREFVASRDTYFRPVQLANGPDGCLWVVDMYRELIEGAAFLPPRILKHLDVASGMDRGRIWCVRPDGHKRRMPKLSKATTAQLVELLEHPNGWHRDTAARLLYQRQDRSAVEPLLRLAAAAKTPLARAHARHALAGLGALDPSDVLAALVDPSARAREDALRLAEPFCRDDQRIEKRIAEMVGDDDPNVRYQLAFSLGALPGTKPAPSLERLALSDGDDSWMRLAILSSSAGCTGDLFRRLSNYTGLRSSAHGRELLTALAAQAGATGRADDLAAVLVELDGPFAADKSSSEAIVLALLSNASAATRGRIAAKGGRRLRSTLAGLLTAARATVVDQSKSATARAAAVRALKLAAFDEVRVVLSELIVSRQPPVVQAAAIETIAGFDDLRGASILLQEWAVMSPKARATAAEALFARPSWAEAFLDAVEKGAVGRADVDAARLDLLKKYPNAAVRVRAERIFATPKARRQDVVATYQKSLELKGDPERGRAIFKDQCSACHRLEGVGRQVGADLAAIRDRGLDSVLLNILDPNREALPQYQSYVLATTSGRILAGMIASETANGVTIRKPDGSEETVPRLQIDELRSTGLSFMPAGLEKQIDVQAMADLLAYIGSAKSP